MAQDEVVSASFIVIPHAHSHLVCFDVVAQRQVHSVPVAPLFAQCFLIHGSNVTSRPHKKLVSIPKCTRSLEGVWPPGRFRSKHRFDSDRDASTSCGSECAEECETDPTRVGVLLSSSIESEPLCEMFSEWQADMK